jgi:aspartyl-tRNA(Asn)/glutamyl-tRNA(Gln) amidotransferase subunit A
VPLSWALDHAGPMARSLTDCRALLAAMAGPDPGRPESWLGAAVGERSAGATASMSGARIGISPRIASVDLEPDVEAGLERAIAACRDLGATVVELPAPSVGFDVGDTFLDVMTTDMLAYHRRFDDRRQLYRPSEREWVEMGEQRAVSGERYASIQAERRDMTAGWSLWFAEHGVTAVLEPTLPVVAPVRGDGYEHAGSDYALISLTHFWDWTGFPVAAMPSGVGGESGLPVSVSLIGPAGGDWSLLELGIELQSVLGVPAWPL